MKKETNVKELIRALEVCISSNKGCTQCPYAQFCGYDKFFLRAKCLEALKSLQELSDAQSSKIHMLENLIEEIKNGYEQTLYLERCRIKDLEEEVAKRVERKPKERYNIYYHKYSIMANDYIMYIKVVETEDIYHEIGKIISQSLEHIKRIRWTKPKATREECEKLWLEDGYERLGSSDRWWNTKTPAPK
ncbi:MAG: hypothetical protein J6L90_02300 [Clostridia bacterium]|nr:hypothetical protein [Clostridia bacterium]